MTMGSATTEQRMLFLAEKILIDRNAEPLLAERLAGSQVTPNDRRAIIDVIAAELCERGFDTDSEPTEYGKELERLIDYLNRSNLR